MESFNGTENDSSILVTIIMTGGIINQMISVDISFSELTAKSLVANFITFMLWYLLIAGADFNTTPLTATIPAGATNTTVRVAVTNDNIVEEDEIFNMSLNVPSSLGPGITTGSLTSATGIIIDTTRK